MTKPDPPVKFSASTARRSERKPVPYKKLPSFGKGLLGILPAAITAALIADTYQGQSYDTAAQISAKNANTDFQVMAQKQAAWSGYPWMDKQDDRIKELKTYGPWDLRQKWENAQIYSSNVLDRVIAPNIIPIAVSIAALYMGFGRRRVHAPFKAVYRRLLHSNMSPEFKRKFKNMTKRSVRGVGRGIGGIMSLPFRSLHHLGFSLALLGLGIFALGRFRDVYSEDAEESYFRDSFQGMYPENPNLP